MVASVPESVETLRQLEHLPCSAGALFPFIRAFSDHCGTAVRFFVRALVYLGIFPSILSVIATQTMGFWGFTGVKRAG